MSTTSNTYKGEEVANTLALALKDVSVTLPAFDFTTANYTFDPTDQSGNPLFETPENLTIAHVTEATISGDGAFDVMMKAVDAHIDRQFKKDRITGDQYAKVYVELITGVMGNATQFVLSRDKAKFDAIRSQMDARTAQINATAAMVNLDEAKLSASKMYYDVHTSAANYALTKMQTAVANAQYGQLRFTIDKMMPVQLAQEQHKITQLMPAQTRLVLEQLEAARGQTLDTRTDDLTPIGGLIALQKNILVEQRESERAKTLDTRSDGTTPVAGSVGKQNELYDQQIDSYKKDARHKAAKMYLDAWITQKTLDEGLLAPTELQNATVNTVLESIRTGNELTSTP